MAGATTTQVEQQHQSVREEREIRSKEEEHRARTNTTTHEPQQGRRRADNAEFWAGHHQRATLAKEKERDTERMR